MKRDQSKTTKSVYIIWRTAAHLKTDSSTRVNQSSSEVQDTMPGINSALYRVVEWMLSQKDLIETE